jgi:hypothetical protein
VKRTVEARAPALQFFCRNLRALAWPMGSVASEPPEDPASSAGFGCPWHSYLLSRNEKSPSLDGDVFLDYAYFH